jgi:SDR family mycofactocin-dependent oxidoreductase
MHGAESEARSLEGKVAFITGAARGQGRSHALRLAQAGADIIAIDICQQIKTVPYPMPTPGDLAETAREVERLGRRIVTHEIDVRDLKALQASVAEGVRVLGSLDIVLANAGIANVAGNDVADEAEVFRNVIDVNVTGVWNTVQAAAPHLINQGRGGAIVLTSSTQGLSGRGGIGSAGMDSYCASKHAVVGLMRTFANWLAPHSIRVNTVNPTGVDTPMVTDPTVQEYLIANPTLGEALSNLMDVPLVDPIDISNAVAYLVSDEARYVTGITLSVDAGFAVK